MCPLCRSHCRQFADAEGTIKEFAQSRLCVEGGFCIDCTLIAIFCYLLLTGVLSSMPFGYPRRFLIFLKHSHKKIAVLALLVLGVHIGLHIKIASIPVAIALSAVVLAGAIWGLNSSKVIQWVTMPISSPRQKTTQSATLKQKTTDAFKEAGNELKSLPKKLSSDKNSSKKALHENKDDDFAPHLPFSKKIWVLFVFACLVSTPAIVTYWICRIRR